MIFWHIWISFQFYISFWHGVFIKWVESTGIFFIFYIYALFQIVVNHTKIIKWLLTPFWEVLSLLFCTISFRTESSKHKLGRKVSWQIISVLRRFRENENIFLIGWGLVIIESFQSLVLMLKQADTELGQAQVSYTLAL